jgi:imidazolonepropionase-like amidohydrolase
MSPNPQSEHVVYTNARLFPGFDEQVVEDGALWTQGNRIRYAGSVKDLSGAPENARQIDAGGAFIMPGMTETHAHLSFGDDSPFALGSTTVEGATIKAVRNAGVMLRSGFTSAISFGSTHRIDVALRDSINSGELEGPRLLAAGRDLGATASNVDSDGALSQIADGPWALRKAVREQRKARVDVVKIFIDGENINPTNPPGELSFCDEEVYAVVDEAHRRKMKVACHARSAAAVKQAVRAGVDYIGHANYLDDEAIDLLHAERDRVFVGPAIAWEIQYMAQCESLGVSKETARRQGYQAEIDATVKTVARLREAGVRLVVGGDYGISIAPHGTYAKDLEYFVDLFGMSSGEALLCATRNGGQAMDANGSLGTLKPDSLADVILVDGDPIADIRVLQDASRLTVIKDGVRVPDTGPC